MIIIGLKKKILLYPVPVIKKYTLCPAGMEFCDCFSYESKLEGEEQYGDIWLTKHIKNISDIKVLEHKGTKVIILKYPIRIEVEIYPFSILLFYVSEEDYNVLCECVGENIRIEFSLNNYRTIETDYINITYSNHLNESRVASIFTNLYIKLCDFLKPFFLLNKKRFHIYWLTNTDFIQKYAFLDAE
jgi:hypothetical protein